VNKSYKNPGKAQMSKKDFLLKSCNNKKIESFQKAIRRYKSVVALENMRKANYKAIWNDYGEINGRTVIRQMSIYFMYPLTFTDLLFCLL